MHKSPDIRGFFSGNMRMVWQQQVGKLQYWIRALGLLAGFYAAPLTAAEVDQYSRPEGEPVTLADSAVTLDAEVNRLLQAAVDHANSRVMQQHAKTGARWIQPRCDEERLYTSLADALAGSVVGQVESFAEEDPQLSRRRVTLEQSIYRDFPWQYSPTLVLTERVAAVINVNGVEMGTDKLGHFFTEGYSYFLATEKLTRPIESGLLFGEWSESVYFGAQTTGVFSYADLTANFQGLRFWNRVLARQTDPLSNRVASPYVQCKNERWTLQQTFHWQDYVDNGWNESINCPLFRSEELLSAIKQQSLRCNVRALPLQKYGAWQQRLLNRQGHGVLPPQLQPEVILKQRVALQDVDVSEATLNNLGQWRQRLEAWRRESALAAQRE